MSALTRFFFTPVYAPRSMWSVVNWWESRRAIFNLTVGTAGVFLLPSLAVSAVFHPHPVSFQGPPWPAIVGYAVMANLCYSLGPAIDVAIHRRWGPAYGRSRAVPLRIRVLRWPDPLPHPCGRVELGGALVRLSC